MSSLVLAVQRHHAPLFISSKNAVNAFSVWPNFGEWQFVALKQ